MKDYILLFLFFAGFCLNIFGQETIKITTGPKKSYDSEVYYVLKSNPDIKHGLYQKYGNNKLKIEGYYKDGLKDSLWTEYGYSGTINTRGHYRNDKKEGLWTEYGYKGKIKSQGNYHDGKKSEQWKTYFSDGISLRNQGNYKEDIRIGIWEFFDEQSGLIQKYNFNTKELLFYKNPTDNQSDVETEVITDEGVIEVKLDRPALYLGDKSEMMSHINYNIRYPEMALDNGTQGTVIITFVIDKEGNAHNFEIKEGIKDGLSEEALRVMKLTKDNWIPAIYNDKPVTTRMTVPIKFRLAR